ncbi:hypothetical protein ACFYWO_01375 [Streptomyces sp. NPDC002932]|uniref:hypothetical protein n=1 Tax=Streptomyces sp. NPDC002932 TaxID=3364672 RepID=UPI00368D5345
MVLARTSRAVARPAVQWMRLWRNRAGRWADGSHTADTVYDRRHGAGKDDPLDKVPQYGGAARAAVAEARAEAELKPD